MTPTPDPPGAEDSFLPDPRLGDALAWLDSHQNLERMLADPAPPRPDLSGIRALVDVLGHPEDNSPVLHITGTNGKTSTARAVTQLLMGWGLTVGTFTSPHLEVLNERIAFDGEPIGDEVLATTLFELSAIEGLLGDVRLSWFELITAAALVAFADRPVDASIFEVGLGGRWDATNVVTAAVAVITNIGLDHREFLGPTRAHIAIEKAGIITPGAPLVLGETDPELLEIFEAEEPDPLWLAGRDWSCTRNELAVGGRLIDLSTPGATYEEVWLDLHGRHQADNFAAAAVAVEAFFGRPTPDEVLRAAAASVRSPGRLEVVGRRPLVVLDGAKNLEGARTAAEAIREDFAGVARLILVVGMLRGKVPAEMLQALGAQEAALVVACAAPSPRSVPAEEVGAAARSLGADVEVADSVPDALRIALGVAQPDDLVLVSGSLYVVGAARAEMLGSWRAYLQ